MQHINPFAQPSSLQKRRLQTLVAIAQQTYQRGWNCATAGNFSIRGDNNLLWQSPSGVPKGSMRWQQFIAVHMDSCKALAPMASRPSAEMPLHAGIYRNLSWVQAVVHVHPPLTVKASNTHAELVFAGKEMLKAFGGATHDIEIRIPIIDNTQDMDRLGAEVAQHIRPGLPVLVLREHGVYAFAKEPQEALHSIEALEYLCQTSL